MPRAGDISLQLSARAACLIGRLALHPLVRAGSAVQQTDELCSFFRGDSDGDPVT